VSLALSIASPTDIRFNKDRLVFFVNLEKWKTSDLLYSLTKPNWLKMKILLSTKERIETGIGIDRFLVLFSNT